MTISSGGLNVNFNQTPTIYEKETSGAKNLQNTADMGKGNVVIASQTDLIPFTKMGDRNVWNYKAEQERPSLMPNTTLRGSGADIQNRDDNWKTHYDSLFNQLPDELKLQLAGVPSPVTATLKAVLDLAANAIAAQERALLLIQTENALARTAELKRFPNQAYKQSLEMGNELVALTEKWVDEIGPNDPSYIESKDFIGNVRALLQGTKASDG